MINAPETKKMINDAILAHWHEGDRSQKLGIVDVYTDLFHDPDVGLFMRITVTLSDGFRFWVHSKETVTPAAITAARYSKFEGETAKQRAARRWDS